MRLLSMLVVLLLALSACSDSETQGGGLLAIVDDGNVVVMDASGENRIEITDAAADSADRAFYFQPTWSADASLLAYSRISPGTGLHLATADGEQVWSIETESLPFYFSWSAGNDLALLRNGASGGLQLELISLDEDQAGEPENLDSGAPLYFSWSPDGSRLVTHIGQDRLEVNDQDASRPLGPQPGAFPAPQWTDVGIFAVEAATGGQRLAVIDADGTSRPLARVLGPAAFVATRDGSRVAIQNNVSDINGFSAAYQELQSVTPNRVVVIDTASGRLTPVTEEAAIAFFWSPQGDKLLLLGIDDAGNAQWSIWSDEATVPVVSFELEGSFLRDMLPFFNQYAQSMSLWSPDGSAFAFPGTIGGESGIWVVRGNEDPVRVSDGTWVSWSN